MIFKFCSILTLGFFGLYPSSEIITTIAGTGSAGYTGDGGLASAATFSGLKAITLDISNNLYIADSTNHAVRMINNTTGNIATIAGTGSSGYTGDAGLATVATLHTPSGIYINNAANIYIADSGNNVIRLINSGGIISTFAGTGTAGYSGNTGLATLAKLNNPRAICEDSSGNFYIADTGNSVIRKISTLGIISTIAGTGIAGYSGDNGLATAAKLKSPCGIYLDSSGNLYIADTCNNVIRIVYSTGIINTFVGYGLASPYSTCLDSSNNLYIADTGNNIIKKVNNTLGLISTIAGTGTSGYLGDAGLAISAEMHSPKGICVDSTGNIYFADSGNNVIRKLALGTISSGGGGGGGGAANPNITTYICGPDSNDSTLHPSLARYDTIRFGGSGSFSGYTAPGANTQKIVITLEPITNAVPAVNSLSTGASAFSSTVKSIWITGDATGFDVVCGSTAGLQLPTPATNCDIHFSLQSSPSSDCKWFQAAIPAYCNVYIEPNSANPMISGLLSGLSATNILIAGISINVGASGSIAYKIQRHPQVPVTSAYNQSVITIGANTTFNNSVHGMSIAGTFTATFSKNSDIVDPTTLNYIIASNKTLKLYGCNAPLPTYTATLMSGTSTQDMPVTRPVALPTIGPHPVLANATVRIPPSYSL